MPVSDTNDFIENEFCWVYLLELDGDNDFKLEDGEVESLIWIPFAKFKSDILNNNPQTYVPHSKLYFETLLSHLYTVS